MSMSRKAADRLAFLRMKKNRIYPKPGDDNYESDDLDDMRDLEYHQRAESRHLAFMAIKAVEFNLNQKTRDFGFTANKKKMRSEIANLLKEVTTKKEKDIIKQT